MKGYISTEDKKWFIQIQNFLCHLEPTFISVIKFLTLSASILLSSVNLELLSSKTYFFSSEDCNLVFIIDILGLYLNYLTNLGLY